jgi:hypothetical protein
VTAVSDASKGVELAGEESGAAKLADEGGSIGGGGGDAAGGGGGGGGSGGGGAGPEPFDNPAHNAADFERLKTQYAQEEILGAEPVGSALKGGSDYVRSKQVLEQVEVVGADGTVATVPKRVEGVRNVSMDVDSRHSAPIYEQPHIVEDGGRVFPLRGDDGTWRNLTQVPGAMRGRDLTSAMQQGIFEYIVDEHGNLVHQEFRAGGSMTGIPGGGTRMRNP